MSKKVLGSGTAIGVFVEEGRHGDDRHEFALKFAATSREDFKTAFWIRPLRDSGYMNEKHAESFLDDCDGLKKMLISSIRTVRSNA